MSVENRYSVPFNLKSFGSIHSNEMKYVNKYKTYEDTWYNIFTTVYLDCFLSSR